MVSQRLQVFQRWIVYFFGKIIVGMVVSGEEKSGKNKLLQGMWKVKEFHFESGKIYIFETCLEKVRFQVNVNLFILSWSLCTLFWIVDRFLTNISYSFVIEGEVGLRMKSYLLFFFNLYSLFSYLLNSSAHFMNRKGITLVK